jgi:hypothetical protein
MEVACRLDEVLAVATLAAVNGRVEDGQRARGDDVATAIVSDISARSAEIASA